MPWPKKKAGGKKECEVVIVGVYEADSYIEAKMAAGWFLHGGAIPASPETVCITTSRTVYPPKKAKKADTAE